MEEGRGAFKTLTNKPTGNIPLGRPKLRWEYNIRVNLKEMGNSTRDCVDSGQDRGNRGALVNATLNLLFPFTIEFISY